MKRWSVLVALDEIWNQLSNLVKGPWPPMCKQQGDGALDLALLVHEMDLQRLEPLDRNINGELRQLLVQFRLGFPPVVAVVPVGGETLDVGQRSPVVPIGSFELIGEVGESKLLLESVELLLGNGDFVGGNLSHCTLMGNLWRRFRLSKIATVLPLYSSRTYKARSRRYASTSVRRVVHHESTPSHQALSGPSSIKVTA